MVEAVSSIQNAVRTYFDKKKNTDIAWERLTPSQIMDYMNQGEDIPEEIVRWAEEVSKLQDAPDDVTYESVNGATTLDEINDANSQSDEPDADDAAEKASSTQAQQFRQSMELSGESKYEQGKAMSSQSVSATQAEKMMELKLRIDDKQAEKISTAAEVRANAVENRTSSLKQELDRLLEKAQNKDQDLSPADLNRIAALGTILNGLGAQAQQDITQIGAQLNELDAEIEQFNSIPLTATDFGTETVDIGAELMTGDQEKQQQINEAAKNANGVNTAKVALNASKYKLFSMLFDRNYRMGVIDLKNGGNAMDAGAKGDDAVSASQANIEAQFARVEGAQLTVEDATGVGGIEIPRIDRTEGTDNQAQGTDGTDNTNGTANQEEDKKSEEVKISSDKTEETDVKDSTLVVDSDELKKRREEKGLA